MEALLRWNHPKRGQIPPSVFIPIAERSGRDSAARAMGARCRLPAVAAVARRRDRARTVGVNFSALQFKGSTELDREVAASLDKWGIAPGMIEIELTESVLMEITQQHNDRFERLRQLGVGIAIDDFGTGYSSLSYLANYPINRVKIAQELVFGVDTDSRSATVVRAAIRLAHELDIEIIAEGMETEGQEKFLLSAGCEYGQGYYFSRPVDAERATELLRAGKIEPATAAAAGEPRRRNAARAPAMGRFPQRAAGYTAAMSLAADAPPHIPAAGPPRHDWTRAEVRALFDLPFPELMFRAQSVHRQNFDPAEVQISTLLSIKTGGCPEDCAYCPQSARYDTGVRAEKLMALDAVLAEARAAKAAGASRFCMGAAWREPKDRDLDTVCAMVEGVRALGLETCATLGMLTAPQARRLKDAGLDYYNHNLDTSPEFYGEIITTRTYRDRLTTLDHVREAGIHVCCGGIVGMGESRDDRIGMIATLATLPVHPESVPINMLVRVAGTPLSEHPHSTRSISCARSLSRVSPCRARWSDSPPAART